MDITIPHPAILDADFTNCPADGGWKFITAFAGMVSTCLLSPGTSQLLQRVRSLDFAETEQIQALPSAPVTEAITAPAGLLVTAIKEGWHLNMTELAAILGVTRPTLYNWLKDRNLPVSKVVLGHLQTLAAAADDWNHSSGGGQQDFLLDYTGPQDNEVTIRQVMSRPKVTVDELRALIKTRCAQYSEAWAQTRKILGDPMPLPGNAPPESSRRLHELWARNTKALHSARNSNR